MRRSLRILLALFALKAERHLRGELVFCKDDSTRFTKSETYGGCTGRVGWRGCGESGGTS